MTIPIVPGPWDFLVPAAQAFANYVQTKDALQQRSREQAIQNSALLLEILGNARPEAAATAVGQAGIPGMQVPSVLPSQLEETEAALQEMRPKTTMPTTVVGAGPAKGVVVPTERPRKETSAETMARTKSTLTDEQRLALGLPLRSAVQTEGVMAEEAGRTARLAMGAQSVQNISTIANSAVSAGLAEYESSGKPAFDATGRVNPGVSDLVWQRAQKDAAGYGINLTDRDRSFIDAEIWRYSVEMTKLSIQRELAQAQAEGQTSLIRGRLIEQIQTQIAQGNDLRQQLWKEQADAGKDKANLAAQQTALSKMAQGVPFADLNVFEQHAISQIALWDAREKDLDRELKELNSRLNSMLRQALGGEYVLPPPAPPQTPSAPPGQQGGPPADSTLQHGGAAAGEDTIKVRGQDVALSQVLARIQSVSIQRGVPVDTILRNEVDAGALTPADAARLKLMLRATNYRANQR